MGRDARNRRRALDAYDRQTFRDRYPVLFPSIAFVVTFFVSLTTGIYGMSRIERLLLWLLAIDWIWRHLQ